MQIPVLCAQLRSDSVAPAQGRASYVYYRPRAGLSKNQDGRPLYAVLCGCEAELCAGRGYVPEPRASTPRVGEDAFRNRARSVRHCEEYPRGWAGSGPSSTPGCHPWLRQVPPADTGLREPWDTPHDPRRSVQELDPTASAVREFGHQGWILTCRFSDDPRHTLWCRTLPRAKSNDNVTERRWFYHLLMSPEASPLLSVLDGHCERLQDVLGHARVCAGQSEECMQVGVDLPS